MIENAPVVGGAVVGGIALIAAAARYYRSGGTVEADVDGDGEPEVSFSSPPENDCQAEEATEDDGTEDNPVPDAILEIEDLESVTGIGPTRAETLVEDGFETAEDLYNAADEDLLDVDGFGEHAVSQIRGDIGGIEGNGEEKSNESTETESSSSDSSDQSTSPDDTDGDGSTGDEGDEDSDDEDEEDETEEAVAAE